MRGRTEIAQAAAAAALALSLVLGVALVAARLTDGGRAGSWPTAILGSVQAGVLAAALARSARCHRSATLAAGGATLCIALLACRAWPEIGTAAVTALSHAAIYGGLLWLFARSLMAGNEAIATRLARRVHAPLTARRLAYTRLVTWVWTGYFAGQFAVSLPLVMWPGAPWGWMIRAADLPLAALLMAAELAVRGWLFRGEPHASAADMLRAVRRKHEESTSF